MLHRTAASIMLSVLLLGGCSNGADADGQTIALAKEAYQEAKARGVEADHFVELDPEGEFIRSG